MNRNTAIASVSMLSACLGLAAASMSSQQAMSSPGSKPTDARRLLEAGNKRFVEGGMESHSWQQEQVVKTGSEGQIPSIGVLSCADSRVPVEIIFDMGVGDLFVNRVAGNFETKESSGTFEYGVHALGVHTIVVLGHTKCGAVAATLAGKPLPGNMGMLTAAIRPGLEQLIKEKGAKSESAMLDAAVEANVRFQMRQVDATSELLRKAHAEGKLQVLGAIYDVDTGKVRFLD